MNHSLRPEPDAVLLARAGWSEVGQALLRATVHELNGRVSSTEGLLQLLRLDGSRAADTPSFLGDEVERLHNLVRDLGLLVGEEEAAARPLLPAEVVDGAVRLLRLYRNGPPHRLDEEGEVMPLVASWPRILRVLLLALHHGSGDAPYLTVTTGEGRVRLAVSVDPAESGGLDDERVRALGELMARDGGTVGRTEDAVVLDLPALERGRPMRTG